MYTHIYIYIYMYMCIYIYIYIHIHTPTSTRHSWRRRAASTMVRPCKSVGRSPAAVDVSQIFMVLFYQ